jgi:NAD(P)-dependent dehydrogenase (short-subunit alcohol dehydrogenase family)
MAEWRQHVGSIISCCRIIYFDFDGGGERDMADLQGHRILVVGASSGIGRSVGLLAAAAGAHVAFAARRTGRLDDAVAEAGGQSLAIRCDVRNDEHCAEAVAQTVDRFGGLDAVVYGAGTSPLTRSHDATGDLWREVLETNVIGAAQVARASLPHLEASGGRLMFLGSSSVGRPYPGLVPYTTTKAALHEMARGLRGEYPWLRVTTFVVGPTMSEFADKWDPKLTEEMFARWAVEGYPSGAAMTIEDMADQVLRVLASGARIEEILVMPDLLTDAATGISQPSV